MSVNIIPHYRFSETEYFKIEAQVNEKLEYYNGIITPMPGGTPNHNELALRIGAALIYQLDEKEEEYHTYSSDMKIYIPDDIFVYPDAVVICGKPQLHKNRKDIITNPLVIIEVLSDSTQKYDQTEKFNLYQKISSFKEYVIVSQKSAKCITHFNNGEKWIKNTIVGLEQKILLQSIDVSLSMKRVYKGISFDT